ncbi:MAG: hypothetical protein HY976_00845 [Candidatus Kerfeldbacteria bacterium]|nr:hypothetical protein [Candidatus Kerfeldbacteria bacterium]
MPIDWATNAFRFLTTGTFTSLSFAALFLVLAYRLIKRPVVDVSFGRRLFLFFLIISLLQLVFLYADLWFEWHRPVCGAVCEFFFPPHSNYYFNEVIVRWASTMAFNAAVGLAGGLAFLWFAKKTQHRIIDQLDVDILTVGGMIAGWPNILVFYGLVFVLTIGLTVVRALTERSASVRMIITPVLPVAGMLVALYGDQISRWLRLYEIGLTVV